MMAIEQAVLLFCSLTLNILRPQKETEWTLSTICETGDFLKKKNQSLDLLYATFTLFFHLYSMTRPSTYFFHKDIEKINERNPCISEKISVVALL